MKNSNSYFSTWRTIRPLLNPHLFFSIIVILIVTIATFGFYIANAPVAKTLTIFAYLHGCLVANLYVNLFDSKGYPMLPGGRKKGIVFSLIELSISCIQMFSLYTLYQTLSQDPAGIAYSTFFILPGTWILGWLVWNLATRLGYMSICLFFIGLFPSQMGIIPPQIILWFVCIILSLYTAGFIQLIKLSKSGKTPKSIDLNLKWNPLKWFQKHFLGGLKLAMIQSYPKTNKLKILWLSVQLELTFAGLGLLGGIVATVALNMFSSNGSTEHNAALGSMFFTIILIRMTMSEGAQSILENSSPHLMSLSRKSWYQVRRNVVRIERISQLIVYSSLILMANFVGRGFQMQHGLIYDHSLAIHLTGFAILIPIGIIGSVLIKSDNDRLLFSQKHTGLIGGQNLRKHPIKWIIAGVSMILFIGAIPLTIYFYSEHKVSIDWIKNPVFIVVAALGYIAVISLLLRFEDKLEKRTFMQGDLV